MRDLRRIRNRGGFSLIEILVIVVVLGVVLVAAIPGIAKYLPRYRLERVAENFVQAVRVARLGAVTLHCNHVLRFWTDTGRTTEALTNTDRIVAFDIWVDRNNNFAMDLPPTGDDRIISYPTMYRDVVMSLSPTDMGAASRLPYSSYPNTMPSPLVFRSDGRAYKLKGRNIWEFEQIPSVAYVVKSVTLGTPSLSDPLPIFRWRWVEIDPLGAVRVNGKVGDDQGR